MVGSMNPFGGQFCAFFSNFGSGQILWLSRHVTSNPKDRYDGFRGKKTIGSNNVNPGFIKYGLFIRGYSPLRVTI